MYQCDKCKKEFYAPDPVGLTLFRGKCMDCLSPEDRERLHQILFHHVGVIEIKRLTQQPPPREPDAGAESKGKE